jgi:AraC-like DNA-binding protein
VAINSEIIINVLIAGNAITLFTFGTALLLKSDKRTIHYLLSAAFSVAAFNILADIFFHAGFYQSFPHTLYISYPTEYLLPPLLYLLLQSMIDRQFKIRKQHFLLFLPFVVATIALVPYFTHSVADKLLQIPLYTSGNSFLDSIYFLLDRSIESWLLFCVGLFFLQTLLLLKRGNLKYDRTIGFAILYSSAWMIWSLCFSAIILIPLPEAYSFALLAGTYLALIVFFYYFYHPEQFSALQKKVQKAKYSKSRLVGLDIKHTIDRLNDLMDTEKYYLNENLTIQLLSEPLGVHPHQLSEILNTKLNLSFSDYINTFRIERAQNLLIDSPNLSILQIAFDSGFRSKSTFNTVFLKLTGSTPSAFRKAASNTRGRLDTTS